MLKEIIDIDKKNKIMRITTLDERWYAKPEQEKVTGLPEYKFYPSVTWISGYYPKGIPFFKWLAQKGWDEAEALKIAAGDKGSKVHWACNDIEQGETVRIDSKYLNKTTEQMEDLSPDEIDCIKSFRDWLDETKPELLALETVVFGEQWAGTIDRIYRIGKQIWILDIKTGQNLWEENKLQLVGYSHSEIDYQSLGITDEEWKNRKLAILQVGYRLNRRGFKFTEIEDKYNLFLTAIEIWKNENPESKPKQKDYPLEIVSKFRTIKEKAEINNQPK
jgi:hypothetical protein